MPPTFPHLKTGHERVVKKSGKICTIRTSTGIMSKKHRYYILNNKTKASADTPLRPPTGQEECIQLTLCAQDINHFEFCCHHKGNCRHDRKEQELPVFTRSTKQWEKFDCFIHWFDFQKIY